MSSSKTSFLALSCVGFIVSEPAHAQRYGDTDENQGRSDIVVNGQRTQEVDLPKQVAPLIDTPRSIVVIPKDVIEQTGSVSLAEALRTVPGITFGAAEGGNPVGDRPFIRGFDSQGSTYVDGVRDFAAQAREVFAIETIQVVRGSDSALGGRGSPGGTINIVSKTPTDRNFVAATAAYGSADFKRFTLDVNQKLTDTIAFRVEGLYHDQGIAGRDEIWSKRWGIAPSLTVGLGTPTRLTAQYYHLNTKELPDTGIPYLYAIGNAPAGENIDPPAIGSVTTIGGQTGYVDRSTYYGLKSRDFRNAKVDQATLRIEHDFGSLTLRNTSRFTHNEQAYIFTQPDDQQGNVFGTSATGPTGTATAVAAAIARGDQVQGGYVWRRANTRYGYADALTNQTDLFGTFDTGPIKHSIALGAEFDWEKARRGAFVLSTGSTISPRCNTATIARFYCTSLYTPNANDPWVNYASDTSPVLAPIVKGATPTETQNDGITRSVYAFDSITIVPNLILNLGGRYDWFKSIIRPGQAATATQQIRFERTDGIFNWQTGLVFKPTANTSIYTSYATSASPPNSLLGEGQEANALPTTATPTSNALLDSLKPEKTRSFEVGAKADLFNGRLNLTAAAFHTEIKNARVLDENNNPQFGGERRIKGIELGVNGEILPGWTAFGGYTHLEPKIIDGGFQTLAVAAVGARPATTIAVPSVNNGRQVQQTAKDSFTAWTNATFFKRFQIGGGAFYTSRVYGGYTDNRTATQNAAGVITVNPATKTILRAIPSYWRFDARMALEITQRINLSINILNITNKTYFSQAYTAHFATIAPGRSGFATLSLRY